MTAAPRQPRAARALRTVRLPVALGVALGLVLGGGGAAYAWWTVTTSLAARTASAAALPAPTQLTCSGLFSYTVGWTPPPTPALPAGASVQYLVSRQTGTAAPVQVGSTTGTSLTLAASTVPNNQTSTVTVQARVTNGGVEWTSPASAGVSVQRTLSIFVGC
ncbi:hypothetical protein [Cellulomonas massiliensis]|uniref:hypothetical protein n=1 Tax=Cellulomonas massiliensis TaxID=1465811 RepID=UPI0002DFCD7E|nr:hypothetical protein [Cellulomonas massiliensis]